MSLRYRFNSDVETVFELLTDPDYLVQRSIDMGEASADCEVSDVGEDETVIEITRKVEQELPAFLSKIFSPSQTVKQSECWKRAGGKFVGNYDIQIHGQPVEVHSSFKLEPTSSGCEYSVDHNVSVKIPVIGKKVGKFVQTQTEDGILRQLEHAKAKLA
jgi:hypothetical protein